MGDWGEGYTSDDDYVAGYHSELSPSRIKLAFVASGLRFPEIGNACELGFGQGLSTNYHASASLVNWSGTDFMPSQVAWAKDLSDISGTPLSFFDDSFKEFVERDDLPEFDFIAMHGVWSWVSAENRECILELIRKKLKVGGVVYLSYNTFPGWSGFAPVRQLLIEHANKISSNTSSSRYKIGEAVDFADDVLSVSPQFTLSYPAAKNYFKKMKTMGTAYLAHEYLNLEWQPMYFSEVKDLLSTVKLEFACSATLTDLINRINFSEDQIKMLEQYPTPEMKETLRDFFVNQRFRKDYWVKGRRKLSNKEQLNHWRAMSVILTKPISEISFSFNTTAGKLKLDKLIYQKILNALSSYQVTSLGQLEIDLASDGVSFSDLSEAIVILFEFNAIGLAQNSEVVDKVKSRCALLNHYLIERNIEYSNLHHVVSPVIGGGISLDPIAQRFLSFYQEETQDEDQLAKSVWSELKRLGQVMKSNDGKLLKTEQSNLERIRELSEVFIKETLPLLKAHLII